MRARQRRRAHSFETDLRPTGFFQGIMRVTQAYDEGSKDMIAGEFARSTNAFHGCSPEILKSGLLGTVDLLWAASPA